MAYNFTNNQNRKKLNEGRTYGFGGCFVKRKGDELEAVMPLTACADFYAEVIHAENCGSQYQIYGFNYSKQDIFDAKNGVAYLVNSVLENNGGGKYGNYDRDLKFLEDNWKNIEVFLNWFEKKLKIKKKTKIEKLDKNLYLFTLPLFWCKGTYLIALYKFLCRNGLFYDGKKDPIEFLTEAGNLSGDGYMWNTIKPKLERMFAGEIPNQIMLKTDSCPHNNGIVNYKFPKAGELYEKKENVIKMPTQAGNFLKPMTFKLT